jgi:hypothetical protein
MRKGSSGFAVKGCRIWGCKRAYARLHPQIRASTTEIPKERVKIDSGRGIGVIYLFFNKAPMKIKTQTFRIAFWILLGVTIAYTSLALNRPLPPAQDTNATPTLQEGTAVVTPEAREGVGSTDGIMLVAVVIVLIVIIPILLKRQAWSNGKRKRG